MEKYIAPELDICRFDEEDIITVSKNIDFPDIPIDQS